MKPFKRIGILSFLFLIAYCTAFISIVFFIIVLGIELIFYLNYGEFSFSWKDVQLVLGKGSVSGVTLGAGLWLKYKYFEWNERQSKKQAAAQSGRTTVENNLLGGYSYEWLQTEKAREHAADVLSCSDNPSGEACKRGLAENKAYAAALSTGSVALLPGGAQAMWGLGAGANAGIGYLADGSIDPANVAIAGWVNVISMGNGLAGTVGWNAAGGALGSWIDDKDPLSGALINGAGSGIGYGIGKGLSWGVNAGANWWKGGWDPKFNAELRSVTEVKGELGLSKEMKPSNLPRSFGDISSSFSSEYGGKKLEPIIEDKLK
ncbi:hypothetical protein OUA02_12285 [Edwardsiella ictaluri]|uniref:Uncharacterized protein n=1 Tax=Edwardsiella ictaluri TaxID=67780 RepID=A0ABY8GI61_EDWIC|nr:hypothetical protein [Edwardsiella ictaluri]WFN97041.1 hypothetical protein MAY91_02630 [Edwardsiella ictaluri]